MEKVRKISKKYYLRQVMACWLMCWMVFGTSIALATPDGGAFTVGTGVINDGVVGGDNTVLVNQAASVIEWGGLGWGGIDTSSSESLTFSQLAGLSNSAVLNNIKSGNVTQFNGTLNGVDMRIFIVNDAGIIFGNGAIINATQLVASSLNISNEDFTNGIYQFSGGGIGEVANYGQISAEQVALIGRKVLNAGVIRSPNGYVLMAAGDRVFLGTKGSGVVVEVSSVTVPDVPAVDGIGDVINEGTIEAAGGTIVLAAGDTFSRAIDGLDGLTVAVESGIGRVGQFGTLSADGVEGDAGSITLTAGDVVALGSESVTTANAGTNGDGGDVIVYSPDTAILASGGQVEAKGGSESGDGGFVEISGVLGLFFDGDVDTSAAYGQMGTLLFDPKNIVIHDGTGATNDGQLNDAKIFETDGPATGTFHISEKKLESLTNTSVKLEAKHDITMRNLADDVLNMGNMGGSGRTFTITANADDIGGGDFRMNTGDAIVTKGANIKISGNNITVGRLTTKGGASTSGNIRLTATSGNVQAGRLIAGDKLTVKASNNITASGLVESGEDMLLKVDTGVIRVAGDVKTKQGDLTFDGDVIANRNGNQLFNANAVDKQLIVKGTITKNTSGNLTLQGGRDGVDPYDIILRGDVTVNQGSLIIGLDGADDDTRVKAGVTLSARDNVRIKDSLYGNGALSLDAGNNLILHKGVTAVDYLSLVAGNEITSDGVISVTDSSLLMHQGASIDTADYMFAGQGNTHLTLISDTGSVTSTTGANAANKWKSIGAHADDNITLARSNGKKTIHLGLSDPLYPSRSLWAEHGKIEIDGFNVANSSAYPMGSLQAGTTLDIDVVHGIDLGGTVTSGGSMGLHADIDTRYGHDVVVGGHIDSAGMLDIEGTNVEIQSAHSEGHMDIYAHGLYDGSNPPGTETLMDSGDVVVHGELTTTDGHIRLEATEGPAGPGTGPGFEGGTVGGYSATGTIYLGDDVTANGSGHDDDVLLLSNTVATDDITIKAYDDVYLKSGKILIGLSDLYIEAGDNVELGQTSETDHAPGGSPGEVITIGNLEIDAGDSVYAYGDLTSINGNVEISSSDSTIHLFGDVFADIDDDGDIILWNNTEAADGVTLTAGDDVEAYHNLSGLGDLTILAGDNIRLNKTFGNTTTEGKMTFNAGLDYVGQDPFPDFDCDPMSGSIKIGGHAYSKGDMTMNATGGGIVGFDGWINDYMSGSICIDEYAQSDGKMTMNAVGGSEFMTPDCFEIVLMNGSIKIGDYAQSVGNMAMSATGGSEGIDLLIPDLIDFDGMNGSIKIGTNAESTNAGIIMTADGGCEFLTNDYVDVDLMDGSIKIGGNITSKKDMELSANGGSEVLTEDGLDIDGMNGSILICGNAEARYGQLSMTTIGGSEALTVDKIDIDGMNGSILVGGYAQSHIDMDLLAVGGSEFLTADLVDIDGMNGSILINNGARSDYGTVTMTAIGGSDFGTCDLIDFDAMNGSIKINNYVESGKDMYLTAIGGSEFYTFDVLDASLMNGSIFINGDAKAGSAEKFAGNMYLTAIGGSDFHTIDIVDVDCMNGSIKVLGDLTTYGDMELSAIGGSEFGSFDVVDIDGMNGSIFIDGKVRAYTKEVELEMVGGNISMTAIGGSDFGSCDLVDIDGMNGSIKITGFVSSDVDMDLKAVGGSEFDTFDVLDIDGMNGSIKIDGHARAYGDMTMKAIGGSDFHTLDLVDVDCMNGSIKIAGFAETSGDMKLTAIGGSELCSADLLDIAGMNGSIKFGGLALAGNDMILTAIGGSELGTIDLLDLSGMNGSIKFGGLACAGRHMKLTAIGGSEVGTLDFVDAEAMNGSIKACGYLHSGGDMKLTAIGGSEFLTADKFDISGMNGSIKILGYAKSEGDMKLTAIGGSEFCTLDCLDFSLMNGSILVGGYLRSYGDMTLTAIGGSDFHTLDGFDGDLMNGSIFLAGSAKSDGLMTLRAVGGGELCDSIDGSGFDLLNGDVVVLGDLESTADSVEIYSSDDTTYLGGDVTAYDSVLLNNNTKMIGCDHQFVLAKTGTLTANGYVRKVTPGALAMLAFGTDEGGKSISLNYDGDGPGTSTYKGNLWIVGSGDIQISDDITTFGPGFCGPGGSPCSGWETGGVLVYSDTGKIYTEDGVNNDTLNVSITGNSDHLNRLGVYNPGYYGPGYDGEAPRAAIVIVSADELKIGDGAALMAYGRYYDPAEYFDTYGEVLDDRAGINFLDYDGSFPPGPVPPAIPRDQGDPFDLAIYVASMDGDVDVSAPVSILSREPVGEEEYECVPKGAMVIDAWDTVTFDGGVPGGLFEASLEAGDVGDRLEVSSRRSEWLQDAVGRIPYAMSAAAKSILWYGNPDSYVLRGAGADNPDIGDDAPAWVLELFEGPPTPFPDLQLPTIEGCPAETQAAASELGITAETIQVSIANALALSPDIHPCQACARLIDAAAVLRDEDGSRMAATIQVFNSLAPADAPFTPEMGASIVTALGIAAEGTQYASVAEYIDAFVEYVTVLETELGAPVGDSTVFAMEKYGAGIAENANIAAYVEARLAGL